MHDYFLGSCIKTEGKIVVICDSPTVYYILNDGSSNV